MCVLNFMSRSTDESISWDFTKLLLMHSADVNIKGSWYQNGNTVVGNPIERLEGFDVSCKCVTWKERWRDLIAEMKDQVWPWQNEIIVLFYSC